MLETPVENLPNTSPLTIRRLKSLNIKSYWDLLNYFPFRWKDYSLISPINKVQSGETVTIIGKIIEAKYQLARTGTKIQKFILQDNTGTIELNWYNQPYLLQLLKSGTDVAAAGEIQPLGRKLIMEPNEYEILKSSEPINWSLKHTARIIPIYPEKRGLSSKTIREKIFYLLNNLGEIQEPLPAEIISFNRLPDETSAYKNIHFPSNLDNEKQARERLAFDELFIIQLANSLVKQEWEKEKVGNKFKISKFKLQIQEFIAKLPFILTNAQKKVIDEILTDIVKPQPMNRFLQGDVGSGKTVVAAIACYLAYLNGYQSLFMAPTEILAFQHYQTISGLFKNYPLKVGLITGSRKISNFKFQISNLDIVIGTHALIQKELSFNRVGLVIVDEQHRFGVAQRMELKNKGINPHLLTMTATPIPRTVMLTLYGELDLSVIDAMPKGRIPIKTYFVPKTKRNSGYLWIKEQIKKDKIQVFIVCSLIEESEVETMKSVKAAKGEYDFLRTKIFPEFKLGLLHGKLKGKEKDEIMNKFKNNQTHILVATPVVEVGIDIPNATIMVIEGAERFGLAQLHQLRGRVGRGKKQSYCFLFTEKEDKATINRLQFFAKSHDGMMLAEKDLAIRGPGEIHGTKQHGFKNLKIASFSDFELIEKTRRAVSYFFNKYRGLDKFPHLKERVGEYNIKHISRD